MQKICDSLNNAGQKTVRGNRFTVNSLRNILVNRAYIGEYKFGNRLPLLLVPLTPCMVPPQSPQQIFPVSQ